MKTNASDQPATRIGLRVQRLVRLFRLSHYWTCGRFAAQWDGDRWGRVANRQYLALHRIGNENAGVWLCLRVFQAEFSWYLPNSLLSEPLASSRKPEPPAKNE